MNDPDDHRTSAQRRLAEALHRTAAAVAATPDPADLEDRRRHADRRRRRVVTAGTGAAIVLALVGTTVVLRTGRSTPHTNIVTNSPPSVTSTPTETSTTSETPTTMTTETPPPVTPNADGCAPSKSPVPEGTASTNTALVVLACTTNDGFARPTVVERAGNRPDLQGRLDLIAAGPSDTEQAHGLEVAWTTPITLRATRNGSAVTIDLSGDARTAIITSTYVSNLFVIPLVGTTFLEPGVQRVTITLDGSAQAAAEWWQAAPPMSWTRADWLARWTASNRCDNTPDLEPAVCTSPLLPSPGAEQPDDPGAARDAVRTAWTRATNLDAPDLAAIDNPIGLASTFERVGTLATAHTLAGRDFTLWGIVFTSAQTASFTYSPEISRYDSSPQIGGVSIGEARRVDGSWKITRATVCDRISATGVTCPN